MITSVLAESLKYSGLLVDSLSKMQVDIKNPIKDRQKMFAEFCSSVTLHGFRYVCEEKGMRRIIWYILFFGALAVSVLLFYGVTQDYFEYKTYLTIKDFNYDDTDIYFPTVTICNKIPLVRQSYERVQKLTNLTVQQFEDFHLKYLTRYKYWDLPPDLEREVFDVLERNNISSFIEAIKFFELNKQDVLHQPIAKLFLTTMPNQSDYPTCRMNYKHPLDTKETISWRESLCHQMNYYKPGLPPLKGWQSEAKKFDNMIAVLDISTTERLNKSRSVRTTAPYMDLIEGVVLYIHPYGEPHQRPEYINRIFLQPGMWHFVKLDYTEVHALPPPFGTKCGKRPYKRVKHHDSKDMHIPYTKQMCILDCFLDKKYEQCGCVGWEFKDVVDLPICNLTQMRCYTTRRGTVVNDCKSRDCPVQCVKPRYTVKVEALDLRSDIVRDKVMKIPGWKYNSSETMKAIKGNLVGIQVEFTSNAKLEVLAPAVTWNTLVGAIGGSIGLAMGLSILTLFEFIFFTYDYIASASQITRKPNSRSSPI